MRNNPIKALSFQKIFLTLLQPRKDKSVIYEAVTGKDGKLE